MLRRVSAIILCATMLFGLIACGTSNDTQKSSEDMVDMLWALWAEGSAESPYGELMTYQAEVNNGGHDQYFLNVSNTGDLEAELSALRRILPETHGENLEKAYAAFLTSEKDETALAVLDECDRVFWENEAAINQILEEYASTMQP